MPIFSASEIQRRQHQILGLLKGDCLVVVSFHNSYYVSGFPMRQFGRYSVTMLFQDSDPVMLVPAFEVEGAAGQSPIEDIRTYGDSAPPIDVVSASIAKVLSQRGVRNVGIEAEGMPAAMLNRLVDLLPEAKFVDESAKIDRVRLVSSPEELAYLRTAAAIADAGMADMLKRIEPGILETGLVSGAYRAMEPLASDGLDVQTFCYMQQNERSAQCHASAMPIPIGKRGFVELLVECEVWHYQVSVERPVLLGETSPELRLAYDSALQAFRGARDAVRPGVTFAGVDAVSRGILSSAGYANVMSGAGLVRNVLHHTGGRLPTGELRPYNDQVLEPGISMTIEPWALIEGIGGVRFCDPVVVSDGGYESLGTTPVEVLTVGSIGASL